MAIGGASSLPYNEPSIVSILLITSFILLLNIVNYCLDNVLYCGLIGQILIGVAYGTPGAKWLDDVTETTISQLGYLGLILLVYEGGLSTSFQSLKANITLSIAVALTGICVPIGLSFALQGFAGATPLQAFAAGAALCSTSLGTTFTVLGTTGLTTTRLGVVLTSAAMLDDVVGLAMVQVISNLGGSDSHFNAITIIRPIFVSIAFAVACPSTCAFVVRPLTLRLNNYRSSRQPGILNRICAREGTVFCIHTAILLAMVTGSTYAGTSNLFASYLTGASISWFDSELPHLSGTLHNEPRKEEMPLQPRESSTAALPRRPQGQAIFDKFYAQANDRLLKPFFFASIGFSIPITRMFVGSVAWRGITYTILMIVGKLVCGAWLIRHFVTLPRTFRLNVIKTLTRASMPHFWGRHDETDHTTDLGITEPDFTTIQDRDEPVARADEVVGDKPDDLISPTTDPSGSDSNDKAMPDAPSSLPSPSRQVPPPKPFSLYPAAILGLAMVARGEIGFLISALADSNGIFTSTTVEGSSNDQIFLIVTWAIVICTVVGPVGVGLLVRRVKRLEMLKEQGEAGRDVLGVWGVK